MQRYEKVEKLQVKKKKKTVFQIIVSKFYALNEHALSNHCVWKNQR